jgi:hypothetical protein
MSGLIPSWRKARIRRLGFFHCFQTQYRKRFLIQASKLLSFAQILHIPELLTPSFRSTDPSVDNSR